MGYFDPHILENSRSATPGAEPPVRAELFSVERLEQHAESLAAAQHVTDRPGKARRLAARLKDNARVLSVAHLEIVKATRAHRPITPAAEWLLDNFHVVDEQIREIKDDLPPGFYRKLPKLADGPLAGYPRVFGIAWALIAHTDSAFDLQKLTRFVEAYQRVQPLTIGELWAIAITLRIMLVENLRRLAEGIVARLAASQAADMLADRILGTDTANPEPVAEAIKGLNDVPWSTAFAVQLAQRLRDRDPTTTPALQWLNDRLKTQGMTTDQIVRDEVQRQGAMNVTVRNVITSMRLVSTINWAEFFESVSLVDEVLREGSDFAAMDFPTRDRYRRAIEELARGADRNEVDIARRVVVKAQRAQAASSDKQCRECDPGFYLLSTGRFGFEEELGCRISLTTRFFRTSANVGVMSYVGMIGLVTALVLAAALWAISYFRIQGWELVGFAVLGFVPASDVAVAIVNRIITQWIGALMLPGLELKGGLPNDLRAIIVVPTLLTSKASVEEHIERLEVHHLSNPDENFSYALLSDWTDSQTEHALDDDELLNIAIAGVARLNERYNEKDKPDRFYLLHRRRVWNAGEGKWIGWERKRGKLHELNRFLRGATDTTFVPINGRVPVPPKDVRYVITLDADTRLPIGAARRLVGKMAHPLNRPRFDPEIRLVTQGHAILQPRVTPSLPIGRRGSFFQRVFSGPNGLDPYALAVSDIYQDLFEEGSYCGKGIYEVDVFEAALQKRIPDSTVLSHDLLEGIFARAGLASDIEVVEEFPSRYDVAAARQHRWVRGDWQLLPWVFGHGRTTRDGSHRTPIPLMGRWKLLDNLRRSLSAPAALLGLLVAWLMRLHVAEVWTGYVVLTIAVPPLIPAFAGVVPQRVGISQRNHWRGVGRDLGLGLTQSAFLITFLAHQAWMTVDAIARTLFRVVTRRRLLEWVTAAQADEVTPFDRRTLAMQIVASAIFAAVVGLLMYYAGHGGWRVSVPFAVMWLFSPAVARWASLPAPAAEHFILEADEARELRLVARRTWRYFEDFVTADDNMLPPDNFQEEPKPVVARRTSPTNIGLYLLSVVAARDFGWLGTLDVLDRVEATFATLDKLEKFRGHFYNWYATADLRALEPKYVSSVDSGNLAGNFIALGNACREIVEGPIVAKSWKCGLEDTLDLVRETLARANGHAPAPTQLIAAADAFAALLGDLPANPVRMIQRLALLAQKAETIADLAKSQEGHEEAVIWANALRAAVAAHRRDVDFLMPWTDLVGDDSEIIALCAPAFSPESLSHCCASAIEVLEQRKAKGTAQSNADALIEAFEKSARNAQLLIHRLKTIDERSKAMFEEMDFKFLFDPNRELLSIGYRGADGNLDSNFYDLLASEARLASFIAIAKGDLPAKHWFRLGRTLTPIDGGSCLISWSGSMFEYLMPSLVMRAPAGSLLEQTNRLVVRRQEEYGRGLDIPWGMSESEYNARDIEQTYQYSSFGVPDLGYKRGLSENVVVAPYASGLAAMVDPAAAAKNFRNFAEIGARGAYGWYEAIDYTRARLQDGQKFAIVRAYMAHHQAMSIVGIANVLHDGAMRARFHAEPIVQAAELLLQERMPRDVAIARPPPAHTTEAAEIATLVPEVERRYTEAHSRVPRTHLLSNGKYSTMVTAAGSGYSRWRDIAVTRWREDVTCDNWGSYIFLRDVRGGDVWSSGYQPSAVEPDEYEVKFAEDRAEIMRGDGSLVTMTEIAVSPEDDAEVRRISITNHGSRTREIELTSYSELALARPLDDISHPAFSKLFIETEFVPQLSAILATRRQRSSADPQIWAAHLVVVEGEAASDVQFETDRARFLGRGQTVRTPIAITDGWPLSNTVGPVLDPIFSLRVRVRIPRGATTRVAFWTMAAATREQILDLADKHHDPNAFERATTLAWTQGQMQLHHLGIRSEEAHLFQRLVNHILYSDPALRPTGDIIKRGCRKASTLWPQGISGDLPIVLVRVEGDDDLELVRQLLRAQEYWRLKQLAVDLVILNERPASYVQDLQTALETLARMNRSMPNIASDDVKGNVFVLRADLVPPETRALLMSCARAVLHGPRGNLADQINRARDLKPGVAPPPRRPSLSSAPEIPLPRPTMEFFNGLGGFAHDGSEYVTILEGSERTPAPWVNVIANPEFGFTTSADGAGFTWSINSQQNKLTPWSNDAVGDAPGEVIYIRDEDTGELWCPTASPIREKTSTYTVRHGQGYSCFEHASHGVALELTQFVPVNDAIKIARLKIANQSGRERRLSITAYVEWVLGFSRTSTAAFIVTEIDPQTGAMFAQNPWNNDFGERVAFADLNGRQSRWTADRAEFIGRDGGLDRPLGLYPGTVLSGRVGAGLDPCCALQTPVKLGAVGTVEIVFFLGQSANKQDATNLIEKYRKADLDAVFAEVTKQWDDVFGAVQVKTPNRALDILVNRWLPYQALSCRVWARTGFYQASGAYGFRDQLQDVMALCASRPDIARAHLLRAAGRQFAEGDVQHWWLPESGRGIRTRVSDDRGWLAYCVAHYVITTGDVSALDEMIPFLDGPVLRDNERDAFFEPAISEKKASLFEHCALALEKSLALGPHGIPLMGTGDWNDGMDRVGDGGRGESVWLGWFLYLGLNSFADLADARGDGRGKMWREKADAVKAAIEKEAWDGDWYRRAYFDDGTPLGSVSNSECRIDSIAQSWGVISGAAEPVRAARAMEAVDKYLIRRDEKLALLFSPPLDHPAHDPGYIKGYPPGIRENGGQYTHAAAWSALAFAMQGDGDKAHEVWSMLNPITHSDNRTEMLRYKVEPYVACADIYSMPPHVGRGGWTWYTGSAATMYRAAMEYLLGFRLQGAQLLIDPCIPRFWTGFEITFRYRSARYDIAVENPLSVCRGILGVKLDGQMLADKKALIPLVDDGAQHRVQIVLG